MPRAPVDMWPVTCARCGNAIGVTNGNAGIEVAIYCRECEVPVIKQADEMLDQLAEYAAQVKTSWSGAAIARVLGTKKKEDEE